MQFPFHFPSFSMLRYGGSFVNERGRGWERDSEFVWDVAVGLPERREMMVRRTLKILLIAVLITGVVRVHAESMELVDDVPPDDTMIGARHESPKAPAAPVAEEELEIRLVA